MLQCRCSTGSAAVRQYNPPEMYCSTSADTLTPSPATASAPAPLAGAPGTAFSNLRAGRQRGRLGWVGLGCREVSEQRAASSGLPPRAHSLTAHR